MSIVALGKIPECRTCDVIVGCTPTIIAIMAMIAASIGLAGAYGIYTVAAVASIFFVLRYVRETPDEVREHVAEAHAIADVAPDTIDYIETHGTGTIIGDPMEVAGLTRALALDPEIVFLDEPTSGLDPIGRNFKLR